MLYVNHLYVESKKCNKVVNGIKEKQRHREQMLLPVGKKESGRSND